MKYLESLLDIGFCTRVKVIFYVLLRKHPFKMSSIRNVFKCLFSVHEGKNLLVRKKGIITYSLFYLSKAYIANWCVESLAGPISDNVIRFTSIVCTGKQKYHVVFGIGSSKFKTENQHNDSGNPSWMTESTM